MHRQEKKQLEGPTTCKSTSLFYAILKPDGANARDTPSRPSNTCYARLRTTAAPAARQIKSALLQQLPFDAHSTKPAPQCNHSHPIPCTQVLTRAHTPPPPPPHPVYPILSKGVLKRLHQTGDVLVQHRLDGGHLAVTQLGEQAVGLFMWGWGWGGWGC